MRGWVRQAERDQGKRAGPTSDDREQRQANEILRKASPYFAQAELYGTVALTSAGTRT
ncbi:transposase-like protein [Skermanella aerolata]|uniref:Transposase n=1 Tax=Skermanella aerolata TaxID=393310 RepID=A0A512DTZ6_9PROT|nr:hypothetical protein N826_23085 [Skermanella aerolata KACC 11604]GEO39944.1 hypothetical protein SAE02_40920 [Skermanella aerolata]